MSDQIATLKKATTRRAAVESIKMQGHPFDWGTLMMVWFPQLSVHKSAFATSRTIQGVAYGIMSFHSGYNEWHILFLVKWLNTTDIIVTC